MPAAFKPAYLIHGDDHGRIGERRTRLRELAEAQSGSAGVEHFEGDGSSPQLIARALAAMTFAIGRRFLVVDDAERWKEKDLEPLEAALKDLPPDTTVAFFAREDGRLKVPARLVKAVTRAGGAVDAENTLKAGELPRWVITEAKQLGLTLAPDAARALVAQVGERQQRLLRELEKLALGLDLPADVDVAMVEALAADSAQLKVWGAADALVRGDSAGAVQTYLTLKAQGERLGGLLYTMSSRMAKAHQGLRAIESGRPEAKVKLELGLPPYAAGRLLADARQSTIERLRQAVIEMADLELASRGGTAGTQHEDTAVLRVIARLGEV